MAEDAQEANGKAKKEDGIIEVKSRKTDRTVQFEKEFGENLEDAVARYGENVVFSNYRQQVIIKCQSRVRQILDKEGSLEEAVAAGESYVPGVITRARVAKDPMRELAAKVASGELSQEELIEQLNAQVAALEAEGE